MSRTASQVSLLGAAAVGIGAGILAGPVGAQSNSDFAFVGVPAAEAFSQAGLAVMLGFGMYTLALATVLFSLAARRSSVLPGWLSVFGIVAGVVMLGSYIWLPGIIFPVWVLVVGVAGTRAPERASTGDYGVPGIELRAGRPS